MINCLISQVILVLKSPSFVTEIPLIVSSQFEKELLARFQAGRQLYNACLTEAMKRVNLVQNSSAYELAKSLPRTIKKGKDFVTNPERKKLFNQAWKDYRFSDYWCCWSGFEC